MGVVTLALMTLIFWDRLEYSQRTTGSDRERYHDKMFKVVHVVDGDTLDIDLPDGDKDVTRIRLWGVDTPETRHPYKKVMHFGPEASTFTKDTMLYQQVRIMLEPYEQTRGRYGRLLAYVLLPDGAMLNEQLLTEGYAYADHRFDHVYKKRFEQLQKEAKKEKRGLWKKAKPSDWPDWYRRRHDPDKKN